MGSKRSGENEGEGDDEKPIKRPRYNASLHSSRRNASGVDPTYGQRGAFGNLDYATVPSDEDLEWEDDTDALMYLRSVRHEAGGIPHIIVAEKAGPQLPTVKNEDGDDVVDRSIYRDGTGDFRGFYQDGAYTALPAGYVDDSEEDWDEDGAEEEEGEEAKIKDQYSEEYSDDTSLGGPRNSNSAEIHEAYYAAITHQYQALRKILQSKPPDTVVAALPSNNPTHVGSFGAASSTFKQWSNRVRNTDPLPAQIASMQKTDIIRLLRIVLGGKFFRKGQDLRERTSRWIWALLARLPDKGELDYQEVGWVRELGKRAVLFMMSLAEADVLREQYGVDGAGGIEFEVDADIEEGIDEEISQHNSDEAEPLEDDTHLLAEANPSHGDEAMTNGDGPSGDQEPPEVGVNGNAKTGAILEKPQTTDDAVSSQTSDVDMQIDSDLEDGEVSDDPQPQTQSLADIEMAKARLLALLADQPDDKAVTVETPLPSPPPERAAGKATAQDDGAARADVNLRATLNMILTVAGEFYGQRDLLEFRDPFGIVVEEHH